MGLKLNCQGMWVAPDRVIWFAERGVIGSQRPDDCLFASVFLFEQLFTQKRNNPYAWCYLLWLLNNPPPLVQHDITCCHNWRGDEGEEEDQDENRGGVCCKGQGWIFGEDHKGVKNQKDEERGGGMCTWCGREEERPSLIQRWTEERDKFFFTCVFKFEIEGWDGWGNISFDLYQFCVGNKVIE